MWDFIQTLKKPKSRILEVGEYGSRSGQWFSKTIIGPKVGPRPRALRPWLSVPYLRKAPKCGATSDFFYI